MSDPMAHIPPFRPLTLSCVPLCCACGGAGCEACSNIVVTASYDQNRVYAVMIEAGKEPLRGGTGKPNGWDPGPEGVIAYAEKRAHEQLRSLQMQYAYAQERG